MALQTYSFSQLVSQIATAMQAAATSALDFTVGSVLRAIAEAVSGVVLWLQALILQLLALTRAATSQASDLDSWMADFDFTRLPASAATGQVTFSRFSPAMQALVPVGAGVQTADGTKFTVTADATNTAYNAGLGGYVIAANAASVNVPVQAVVAGTSGNVQSGTISQITTAIQYVDTVTNAAAFLNGIDAETDPAFRARFVLYLASLSKGIKAAILYAVTSLGQGIVCTAVENQNYAGSAQPGYFYVTVDDGTGYPSSSLLTNAANAIEAVRGFTINYGVFPPIVEMAAVSLTITSASGYTHSAVVAAVVAALQNFIDGLPLGTSLPYTQIAAVAYGVPGVVNVSSVLLNSATSDLTANQKQKIVAGAMTIA